MDWRVLGVNTGGARFSAPIKISPGVHPAFYTMSNGVFLGVRQSGHGVNYPFPSSTMVKEKAELYFYSPSGPSRHLIG